MARTTSTTDDTAAAVEPAAAASPGTAGATADAAPVPAVGDTLHVRWDVQAEDPAGGTTRYWWPAVVTAIEAAGPPPVVHLTYGAAAGFPASSSTATLVSASTLADAAGGGVHVAWRPAPAGAEVVELAPDEADLTMPDVEASQAALDAATGGGTSVHAAGLTAFGTLPAEQQRRLAAGYRALADGVKARLREVLAERGEGGVVTEADVRSIMQSVQAELAQQR
ncbi:hypothetical protein I4F81_009922 [Pyropia yezoensis]|uniref:Uncharacterized protein n=1 Tax=Pyropia yezoensis TaxID=2788 RepID=A0ACC3CBG0_PYRYE|nr:hypothetical protein I4F81_009922 [Neopyropia yezoensis]